MAGLPADAIPRMHAAARGIRDRDFAMAQTQLVAVLSMAPEHPEALRLLGLLHNACQRHHDAESILLRALAQSPDDALILNDLGNAQQASGKTEAALASWRHACDLAPEQPMPWFNLGRNLQLDGRTIPAIDALQRACTLAPDFVPALVLLGDAYVHLGEFAQARERYRAALRAHPACGDAWRGLANIKTQPLSEADREQLAGQVARPEIADNDRIAMGYALGKVCEDQGRDREAFAAIAQANALLGRRAPWQADAFGRFTDRVIAATSTLPAPIDPTLGREAILIVGVPRSGSTLIEQILAAHPDVEGASELPELERVMTEESARRGMILPQWAPAATAEDWHRLGSLYLERTARWRERRPRFTDKMPENWLYVGALQAMLPGALVIDSRRDPLELGWSCFKQHFYRLPHFSCDLADTGAYIRDCWRAIDAWQAQRPQCIRIQSYEALQSDPETQIRALLEFCGLAFDAQCLTFHQAARSVRTASAAQVRQPLRRDTARAARYGAALDPLRAALSGSS